RSLVTEMKGQEIGLEYEIRKGKKLVIAVKLCLEYEFRKGKKLVKKELMVLLCGEIYFVQFIINPEEDEFEPGLIFRRSFLHSANAIVNFEEGTITTQPDFDPFLLSSDEEGKPNLDELKTLLDFDFDEVLQTEIDLPPMVCKCGMGDCKMDEKKGNWKSEGQLDLLWTTLRELIDSEDRLILEILVDDILRVAA
ncbi:hypothetical protein Tco_0020755, partial [Tanacetum coccineum]